MKTIKKLKTKHGNLRLPVFLPDATYGVIKAMSFEDLRKTQIEGIVTNTLHLEGRVGSNYIRKFGGVHKFFGWDKPILTDSGGYQVFSLIYRNKSKKNFITNAGCTFFDERSGKSTFLSPEFSQIIQFNLGADIVTVLDVPLTNDATTRETRDAISLNTKWAKRSKDQFLKLNGLSEEDFKNSVIERPLLGAVIQGGNNKELRYESAMELMEIGFDIYNFGGAPLHNDVSWHSKHKRGFNLEMLSFVSDLLPNNSYKYAMGVGSPDNIKDAVEVGWNIFDTVIPTRNGRHGTLYVSRGNGDVEYDTCDVLHIRNERYKFSEDPIDSNCDGECCRSVSRAYMRHLIKIADPVGWRLASMHNLRFFQKIMAQLQGGI